MGWKISPQKKSSAFCQAALFHSRMGHVVGGEGDACRRNFQDGEGKGDGVCVSQDTVPLRYSG